MICPKCQNVMRTVDKNGVHVEQCQGCRGIFLDRGELEQVAGAENAFYGSPPPYRAEGHHHGDSPRPYQGGYGDSPRPYRGQRRRGFLENLFD